MRGGDIAALPEVDGSALSSGLELAMVGVLTLLTIAVGVLVVTVIGACRNKRRR